MPTTYTLLLEIPKHDPADQFNIQLINEGFDKTDAAMAKAFRGKAAHNLLDNSDFSPEHFIAQAGLNGKHGTVLYLGDRWNSMASVTATQQTYGVLLTTTAQSSFIWQKVSVKAGEKYTFAIHATDRTSAHRIAVYNANNSVIYAQDYAADRDTLIATFTASEDVVSMLYYPGYTTSGGSSVLHWAALYDGEYTADTLPAYAYKGYAAELAECMLYYQSDNRAQYIPSLGGSDYFKILNVNFSLPMRTTPTLTATASAAEVQTKCTNNKGFEARVENAANVSTPAITGWEACADM